MSLSFLSADMIRLARDTLSRGAGDWESLFEGEFRPPPAPAGVEAGEWPQIAEHVARAERVSEAVRRRGLAEAVAAFGDSPHAIEVATVATAAEQVGALGLDLLELLFSCELDDYVAYGTFLDFLVHNSGEDPDRAIAIYERFCAAASDAGRGHSLWRERADAARDSLADLLVKLGRFDDGDALFRVRHGESSGELVVALTASRTFLAAGALARAAEWLGAGADRARALGRPEMEARLRRKKGVIEARMS